MDLLSNPDERCQKIMQEIAPGAIKRRRTVGYCIVLDDGPVRLIYVWHKPERNTIELAIMPGDTIKQARLLYNNLNVDRLLNLRNDGWKMRPNLHFSHMEKHLYWSKSKMELREYLEYWNEHPEKIAQAKKDINTLFNPFFDELQKLNLIIADDREELNRLFNLTGRHKLSLCPGIYVDYSWPLNEAAELDRKGLFVAIIRTKIIQSLSAWNQNFVPQIQTRPV